MTLSDDGRVFPSGPPYSPYLLLPTGSIDSSQTCSVQEAALMEADTDEVRSTVGRCAHQNTAIGQKVVNLVVQFANTRGKGVELTGLKRNCGDVVF